MGGLSEAQKKDAISNKITHYYLTLDIPPDSEKDFKEKFKNSLSDEEKIYLENEEVKKHFDEIANKFYIKIKAQKEQENKIISNISDIYDAMLKKKYEEVNSLKKSISVENNLKQEEYDNKLKKMMNDFNNKLKEVENKNNEEKERMTFQNEILQAQFISTIESLTKQMNDEKEEAKKKEYEKKIEEEKNKEKKKKELFKLYNEKVEKIKSKKIKELEIIFEKQKENFCVNEISKFAESEITKFIKNFLKTENIPSFILDLLIQMISLNKDIIKNIEHLNIALVGPSGVGKSTLINAILDIDVKTGFGIPQTKDSEYFISNKIPFLRLADSRGIEKNTNSGVDSTFKSIKYFIESQLKTKEYDNFVHIIWYCWTGTRLESSEIELFKKLSKEYSIDNIPVIIVYTNAIFKNEIENARKFIKDELKLENDFIDVLALKKEIEGKEIKARNLDILVEKSLEYAKSAIKSSIYQGLIKEVNIKIDVNMKGIMEELKTKINLEINSFFEKKGEDIGLKDFHDKTKNIILNTLYKYFILTPDNIKELKLDEVPKILVGNKEFSFSKDSTKILNDFCLDYFGKILNSYQKSLEEFLSTYSKGLAQEIRILRLELDNKNKNLLSTCLPEDLDYESILKQDLIENFKKKAEFAALSNSFKFIIKPLIEKIGEYFSNLYKKLMEKEKFINEIRNVIKGSFTEIEKKIKDYIELKKKEKEKGDLDDENKGAAPSQVVAQTQIEQDIDDLTNDI